MNRKLAVFALLVASLALQARGACVNKFVRRTEGNNRQVVTLLTGKLTFEEAKALAEAINAKTSPPLEWVDDTGKAIARQFGELKVVRPMPVGCDGRASGVIVIVTFMSGNTPMKKMSVKLDAKSVVPFDEQSE